ncbi:MFS transporter (plasmid) [Acinetobacter soli]|nr:MFS transporter [Acinetobacter soli]WEH90975.1 MFS transporter [Acinetobacter soli]WEI02348.1 MFS transporter [Acinetobacter soli]
MPMASIFSNKFGCRKVTILASCGLVITLPLLAFLSTPVFFALALFFFGLSIGAIDVAANIHGTQVQTLAQTPLMSNFHGFYSIGGLVGVTFTTLFLAFIQSSVFFAALLTAFIILICMIVASFNFLPHQQPEEMPPLFVMPKGIVLIIGLLCLLVFLAEGAFLDWGAILLVQEKQVDLRIAGIGYVAFALALTISRFTGDKLVTRFGENKILFLGLFVTGIGLLLTALSSTMIFALLAISITGLAAGNLVPIIFSLTAKQTIMPVSNAISAVSFLGYLGVLLGPACIGYIAGFIGLNPTFYVLGGITIFSMMIVFFSKKIVI